jgi:hypothetical protein
METKRVHGSSAYPGELFALRTRIEAAQWVLTHEVRPQAFEAEMLAPRAQKPVLRRVGEELLTVLDDLNRRVLNLIAEEEAGSLG